MKDDHSEVPLGSSSKAPRSIELGDVGDGHIQEMGYTVQVKRELNVLQMTGTAFSITASWLGVTGGFATGVLVGGPVVLVWGLVIMAVIHVAVSISLAELISAMPNSGGQYYWVMRLAPPKYARFCAYVTGMLNLLGGLCATASISVLVGQMIMGCVNLFHPDFVAPAWQIWLIGIAYNLLTFLFNFREKLLARAMMSSMVFSILAWLVVLVVLPVKTPSHTSASFIFTSTENISGWPSFGMAFMIGLLNANWSFGLIDAVSHLAEEIVRPDVNVPRALFASIAIGFVTAWPLAIVLVYCMSDFDAVTSSPVPLLETFHLVFSGNRSAAVGLLSVFLVAFWFAMIGLHTYQMRICWAFSRDNGLPFSNLWSQVPKRYGVPINAHLFCLGLVNIITLLCIASTTAFNSLITAVLVFPNLSIMISVVFSLLPRNSHIKGPYHFGVLGKVCKITTIAFTLMIVVIYSFPYYIPVQAGSMNYFSVILVIALLGILLDWTFRARHDFGCARIIACRD